MNNQTRFEGQRAQCSAPSPHPDRCSERCAGLSPGPSSDHRRHQLREKAIQGTPYIAFGITNVLNLPGNLAAALPLFPATGAAWGLARVMTWALRR